MKKIFTFVFLFALTLNVFSQMDEPAIKDPSEKNMLSVDYVPKQRANQNILSPVKTMATTTVLPNNGSTSQNGRSPQGGRRFIRTVYLITPAEMTTSGYGTQPVNAIGWSYLGSLFPMPYSSTGNLKVWMQSTANTTYAKGTVWTTALTGMTLMANGPAGNAGNAGNAGIFINAGGSGTSPFSTTAGQGVYIAFEYYDSAGIILPFSGDATVSCTNVLAGSAATYQSQTTWGTTLTTSAFRAETIFSNTTVAGWPLNDIVQISDINAQGLISSNYGSNPDKIQINFYKTKADTNRLNINVRLLNRYPAPPTTKFDTTISLYKNNAGDSSIFVNLPVGSYSAKRDSIVVTVNTIPGENVTDNNSRNFSRETSCGDFSYIDENQYFINAVGVSTAGGEMICAYKNSSASPMSIDEINYYLLFSAAGAANSAYNVVVYPDSSTVPGIPSRVASHVSPTLLTPATINTVYYVVYTPAAPITIPANTRFYIGLRQGTINAITAYQTESPIRKGSFYFRTAITGVWNDESVVPFGNVFRLSYGVSQKKNLQLSLYLEGFFDGSTQVADTVTVKVRSQTSPYPVIDQSKAVVNSSGVGNFRFSSNVYSGDCYYFEINHRNHIRTFSHSTCEQFDVCGTKTYNFTDSITKALGSNMTFVTGSPGGYALFTGDVNQDETIDAGDLSLVDNDAALGVSGYVPADLNGDEFVDSGDLSLADNNSAVGIFAVVP